MRSRSLRHLGIMPDHCLDRTTVGGSGITVLYAAVLIVSMQGHPDDGKTGEGFQKLALMANAVQRAGFGERLSESVTVFTDLGS